jgi:DNA-binding NarL/FixJ family response regulator
MNSLTANPMTTQTTKLRVLVADDSTLVRAGVIDMINQIPEVEVVGHAEDGVQAIAMADQFIPDVAILDIRMPEKNGIQALEEIKRSHPQITVIMLTNFPYLPYRKKCLAAGADYFLEKSMEFNTVVQVLTDLSRKKLRPEGNE